MGMHFGVVELLTVLFVGAVVGWLASVIMKTRMGLLGYIVIGIVGSAIGHSLFGILGLYGYGLIGNMIISTAGAAILIAVLRGLRVLK
jgi:uncharacterized membrane protein YeaQ/YmgE (transglycosylase-associated protein family)